MNIQDWFSLGLIGFVFLKFKKISSAFSSTRMWKHQFFGTESSLRYSCHSQIWLEKTQLWIYRPVSAEWCLCFIISCVVLNEMIGWLYWYNRHELGQTPRDSEGQRSLVCSSPWSHKDLDMTWWLNKSRIFIAFFSRRKWLLISRLQSPSAVILETKKIKSVTAS